MKYLFTLFLIAIVSQGVFAQAFYVVNDPDGYVNVRADRSPTSKVKGRINRGEVVLLGDVKPQDAWWPVYTPSLTTVYDTGKVGSVPREGFVLLGYVYKNRLISIEHLPSAGRLKLQGKLPAQHLIIQNDRVRLSLTTQIFNRKAHHVLIQHGSVDKIDGKQPYGIDGELPHTEIKGMELLIDGIPVSIPRDDFNDLFEPRLESLNVYIDKRGCIYICMPNNSDGAGSYGVVWVVKDSKVIARYLDNSEA
ncbi:hypothetical protein C8P68_1064 [Mucilaginibacter yixingensis]|uniref:SH3 domain-containing protein n=1 Tax=Mucilaginibacter yixingensis TaxID=1295612 RepID=A0A2T5J6M7_9SPHI|nr:hypothetical protein [Mucilaginibacter yixingensis]PTQ94794.1 hypothetical protein C8P68_1064 [Mucilaginibacter yixingensis]